MRTDVCVTCLVAMTKAISGRKGLFGLILPGCRDHHGVEARRRKGRQRQQNNIHGEETKRKEWCCSNTLCFFIQGPQPINSVSQI